MRFARFDCRFISDILFSSSPLFHHRSFASLTIGEVKEISQTTNEINCSNEEMKKTDNEKRGRKQKKRYTYIESV